MVPSIGVPLESTLGPLAPEHMSEIVVGIVLMLLVAWIMWKSVVPAFEKMYAERSDAIQGGMERASQAQAEAEAARARYLSQLDGAREEASQIREDAKAQGAQMIAESREKASAEAARILEQARVQIAAERQQASQQLRSEIGGLATTLAGRIVGEQLNDDERARASVDRFIAELDQQQARTENRGATAVGQMA